MFPFRVRVHRFLPSGSRGRDPARQQACVPGPEVQADLALRPDRTTGIVRDPPSQDAVSGVRSQVPELQVFTHGHGNRSMQAFQRALRWNNRTGRSVMCRRPEPGYRGFAWQQGPVRALVHKVFVPQVKGASIVPDRCRYSGNLLASGRCVMQRCWNMYTARKRGKPNEYLRHRTA